MQFVMDVFRGVAVVTFDISLTYLSKIFSNCTFDFTQITRTLEDCREW